MPDWTPLLRLVDATAGRRSLSTNDSGLVQRDCPAGHPTRILNALVGIHYEGVQGFEEQARRLARPEETTCAGCGSALGKDAPWQASLSSYLPGARAEVLVHVAPGQPAAFALREAGGAPREVSRDHPVLQEVAPASAVRALLSRYGGVTLRPTPEEAEAILADVLARWPGYAPALVTLGRLRKERGEKEAAREPFERAVAAAPDDPQAHFWLADLLDEVGEEERALRHYDESIRLDPTDPAAHSQRGIVLKRAGRLDDALASYDAALRAERHHPHTILNAIIVHQMRGDEDAIFALLSQALPSAGPPHLREAFLQLSMDHGAAAAKRGHWLEAARSFELAAHFAPSLAAPLFNWALGLASVGAWGDALAKCRRALAVEPAHAQARALAADAEKRVRAGLPDTFLAARAERTIRYVDPLGVDALMLNVPIDRETTTRLVLRIEGRATLARDEDLLRLLLAKGHNARVGLKSEAKGGIMGLLSKAPPAVPTGEEGRVMVLMVDQEPEPDFLAFAAAGSWTRANDPSRTVASAPVPVLLVEGERERALTDALKPSPAFALARSLDADAQDRERAYPRRRGA